MTRLPALAVVFAALLALSACGSDSSSLDSSADDATTETTVSADAGTDDTAADDSGTDDSGTDDTAEDDGGDSVAMSSFDELPQACRDALGEFLRTIEPAVSEVDWENATLADMETMGTDLDSAGTDLDAKLAEEGCEDFEPDSDEETLAGLIEFAEDEAPGTVGWLTFIGSIATGLDDNGLPTGDGSVPADCDGAIAYVEGLIADADSMMELPVNEIANLGVAVQTIEAECSLEQSTALFEENADFFGA